MPIPSQDPDPQISKKISLGQSLGSQKNIDKNVAFRAIESARQRGVLTGASQMRRRRACAFLPDALPLVILGAWQRALRMAQRVSVALVGIRWG
jgi:hypothetical protein